MKREIITEGKTKIVYKLDNGRVEIVSKSDITAGDGAKRDVMEGKDFLANNTTCNNFELLRRKGIRSHFEKRWSKNSFVAKRCKMIPVEVVMRRIATGSYLKRNPEIKDGTVFDEVKVEFFHKDDELHDPYILRKDPWWERYDAKKPIVYGNYIDEIEALCTGEEAQSMEGEARKVFLILEKAFKLLDVVLWDLKIEFGRTNDGKIVVADVIDNDSWRIRTRDGEQLDKQLYRDGKDLKTVKSKYQIVSDLTDKFIDI